MVVERCTFVLSGSFREAATMVGGSGPRCLSLEHSHRLFQLFPGVSGTLTLRADRASVLPVF